MGILLLVTLPFAKKYWCHRIFFRRFFFIKYKFEYKSSEYVRDAWDLLVVEIFNPSIFRHSGIGVAADEAVLNKVKKIIPYTVEIN